jgi:hypothetical protein
MKMKRVQREDIEREMQELEAILAVAAGEYSEEDYAKLCAMVHTLNEVKRELLEKRPSMERIEQLVRDVNRSELEQIAAELKARVAKSR